jgi:hypothetical protein
LRSDIGKNNGVTTLIEAGTDLERGDPHSRRTKSFSKKKEPAQPWTGSTSDWNNSESKLTDVSSEDNPSWLSGIRKTTVSTQNVQ